MPEDQNRPNPAGDGVKLDPIRLRFSDPAAERRFNEEHLSSNLKLIRLAMLVGCLIYAAFGILDWLLLEDTLAEAWAIRFGLVCPAMLGTYALSYHSLFREWHQLVLSTLMFIGGIGIIAMTAIVEEPINQIYYAGLILVIIYCTALFRIYFITSAMVSIILFVIYMITTAFINPIPFDPYASNLFFLTIAVGVGICSSYAIDLYTRHIFLRNEILKRTISTIQVLHDRAEAASRAKSDFLATMSHELRTPLNAILGFSDIIKEEMYGPVGVKKYKEYAEDIHKSGGYLLDIISDILDLSKAEAGTLSLDEGEVDFAKLVDDTLRLLQPNAKDKKVRLIFSVPKTPIILFADGRLLRQTLINIVSNALKFTEPGGYIHLQTAWLQDGSMRITVEDSGIGIRNSDIELVFEPFVQLESAYCRERAGAGLGLPLVKKVIELHGGAVNITSELGVGTKVIITLPSSRFRLNDQRKSNITA